MLGTEPFRTIYAGRKSAAYASTIRRTGEEAGKNTLLTAGFCKPG